jgi:hypothetical protein
LASLFREAEAKRKDVLKAADAGALNEDQLQRELDQIRVTAPDGSVWQQGADGQWLRHDGSIWEVGDPYGDEFDNAALKYQRLKDSFSKGEVDQAQFQEAVGRIQISDPDGSVWAVEPESGAWTRWDGKEWHPAEPPRRRADGQPSAQETPFAEFERSFSELKADLAQGRITEPEFQERVLRFRTVDENGDWWQLSPETQGWLKWSGTDWRPAEPPRESQSTAGPARRFAKSLADSAKEELKSMLRALPKRLFRSIVMRAVMAGLGYFSGLYLHAYTLGFVNMGTNEQRPWGSWLFFPQGSTGAGAGAAGFGFPDSSHGSSYAYIWGIVGMLLTSLVFTGFRKGGWKRVLRGVSAPFAMISGMRTKGLLGLGSMAFGIGAAIMISSASGVNRPATISMGIGMFFIGAGPVGRYISRFLIGVTRRVIAPAIKQAKSRIKFDLKVVQLAVLGAAPGFYVASLLGKDQRLTYAVIAFLAGAGLLVMAHRKKPVDPVIGCTLLLGAVGGSVVGAILAWLSPEEALADDHGRDEFNGGLGDYWEESGGVLVSHSRPAAAAAGVGGALGTDLDDGQMEYGDYTITLHLSDSVLRLAEDSTQSLSAWITVSGPDPEECEDLENISNPLIKLSLTGNAGELVSILPESFADGVSCQLELKLPEWQEDLDGPYIAHVTASLDTPHGTVTQRCRINLELGTESRFSVEPSEAEAQANSDLVVVTARLETENQPIGQDADFDVHAETPQDSIKFSVSGDEANWVGGPGPVPAEDDYMGKQLHMKPAVPFEDVEKNPPFWAEYEATCELESGVVLSKGGRLTIQPPDWILEIDQQDDRVGADGEMKARVRLRVSPADRSFMDLYLSGTSNLLNGFLEVTAEGEGADLAIITAAEDEGDWKVYDISVSENHEPASSPSSIEFFARVSLTGQSLSESFRVAVDAVTRLTCPEAEIAVRPGGPMRTVLVEVEMSQGQDWRLESTILGVDRVYLEGEPTALGDGRFELTINAPGPGLGNPGIRGGSLSATAIADSWNGEVRTNTLEVPIKLVQPGVLLRPEMVVLPLDPAAEPPAKLEVLALQFDDESQSYDTSLEAISDLNVQSWEDISMPGAANVFKGAGVFFSLEGSETGVYAATIWGVSAEVQIPAPEPVEAMATIVVDLKTGDAEQTTITHPFRALAAPSAAMAALIAQEQDNCRSILKFVPPGDLHDQISETIDVHGRHLGAEGLYELRHQIWSIAHDSLRLEAESSLSSAKAYGRLATAADWTAYVFNLTRQAMASVAIPFPGDLVFNVLMDALPDFLNKVAGGMHPVDWMEQWFNNFIAGSPMMATDIALAHAVSLEGIYVDALKKVGNPLEAGVVACAKFTTVHFIKFYMMTKNNGDPHSLSECFYLTGKMLAEELVGTAIARNATAYRDGLELPGVIGWLDELDPHNRHGYDEKDQNAYARARSKPDIAGMPDANLQAAREIARRHGVELYIRPTNPAARVHLENGAHPKPMYLKAKSISPLDVYLGRRQQDVGLIGFFDPGPNPPPKPPGFSDAEYGKLIDRYHQRKQEFANNKASMDKLKEKGVTVDEETGVITHSDGVPYTGDHDIYDIRDAEGNKVSGEKYDAVMRELEKPPFKVQHGGHRQWDYSDSDRTVPPPTTDAHGNTIQPQSKFESNQAIDHKIIDSHFARTSSGQQGEGLVHIDAEGNVSNMHVETYRSTFDESQTTGQSAVSTMGRQNAELNEEEDADF